MVRKISVLLTAIVLVFAVGNSAQAVTYTAYDGTMSNTYVQYFKDILSGAKFTDNYVALRSGQYEYIMVVGDIDYTNGSWSLTGEGKQYRFVSSSNYGSDYSYTVSSVSDVIITAGNEVIYSDVGGYPELIERGAKYEMLSAVLMCILLLGFVISRLFYPR